MSRRILIALDGSKRAESVLRYITPFVHPKETRVWLLHVLPEPNDRQERKMMRYLREVARRIKNARVGCRVVCGGPEEKITQEAEDVNVDLVAMCTHGAQGGTDRYIGSFASAISHSCPRNLLLVRPRARPKDKPPTALCPLVSQTDLKRLERTLSTLFEYTQANVTLVRIGRPFRWTLGGTVPVTPRSTRELTQEINALAARLKKRHVRIDTRVTRGDPEDEILRILKKTHYDFALTPTSRILFFGWRMGQLATRVLSRTFTPVVLMR